MAIRNVIAAGLLGGGGTKFLPTLGFTPGEAEAEDGWGEGITFHRLHTEITMARLQTDVGFSDILTETTMLRGRGEVSVPDTNTEVTFPGD